MLSATEIIGHAHEARTLAEQHRWLLVALARVIGADSALAAPAVNAAPTLLNKQGFAHLLAAHRRDPSRYEPGFARGEHVAARGGGVYLDTEVYTPRERATLPFYAEVVRPQGITSQLVAYVGFQGRALGRVFLCRHGAGRAFRARDRERLAGLMPAIALADAALAARNALPTPALALAPWPAAHAPLDAANLLARLTPREAEVARLMARGLSNAEVARALGNSPHTVHNQARSIFARLEVRTRAQLAALLAGAVSLEPAGATRAAQVQHVSLAHAPRARPSEPPTPRPAGAPPARRAGPSRRAG